ncbi:DUF2968 domain-containing protein [Paraburkholderia panacisoli]|uniref:DUF2968 domain-containing protein n=1 Tax=Paraburkholderia panacisoli TaxID=2603818 RepID=A0A5B0HAM3_9BURK|nr:DUF2968 domain-containing protein [Paraburkholderia panacisoli]KAA1012033.1 DUF2968 domain-containing protein [Paraburkholderia panacisoli]
MKSILELCSTWFDHDSPESLPVAHDDDSSPTRTEPSGPEDGETASLSALPSTVEPARILPALSPVSVTPNRKGRNVESGDMAAISQLIEMKALTSFRLLQCFDYSANLFFDENELTYYVTLHQDTALSRALKTIDLASAESVFLGFEQQVKRLAASVARCVQLEAENRRLARLVAQSEAEFERLRENLREESAQARSITARERQVRKDVTQLEVQRVATQAYLGRMRREIQRLTLISKQRLPRLSS